MKIGDIVYSEAFGKGKIVDIDNSSLPYWVEFENYNGDLHDLDGRCKGGYGYCCTDDINHINLEEIITPYKFTKKDLRVGDKLTNRFGIEFICNEDYDLIGCKGTNKTYLDYLDKLNEDLTIKDRKYSIDDIVKIERPTYITVFERKEEILNKKEKEYLAGVIRPFKDDVEWIKKEKRTDFEFIYISLDEDCIPLPYFKKGTMYKGMEVDKKYTLKELGLD